MFTRCALILGLALPISWAAGQEGKNKEAVRELDVRIDVKGLKRGQVMKPTPIADEEELKNVLKESSEAVAAKVNFNTEKLLFFYWGGSGQDKLSFVVDKGEKGPLVLFHYQAGLTRDLRPHVYFFAMPKEATWKVVSKGRGE